MEANRRRPSSEDVKVSHEGEGKSSGHFRFRFGPPSFVYSSVCLFVTLSPASGEGGVGGGLKSIDDDEINVKAFSIISLSK